MSKGNLERSCYFCKFFLSKTAEVGQPRGIGDDSCPPVSGRYRLESDRMPPPFLVLNIVCIVGF